MVGRYDVAHCGNCGNCEECGPIFQAIAEGVSDYQDRTDELGGTWSYGNVGGVGYAETSGTAGIAGIDPATGPGVNFDAVFKLTPSDTNIWRVGVGADANNYLFAEPRVTKVGSLYFFKLLTGKMVGGGASYLTEHPDSATVYPFINFSSGVKAIRVGLNFDADDGALTAYWYDGVGDTVSAFINFGVTARNQTSLGNFAGIFALTVNGSIRIRDWRFQTCGVIQSCTRGAAPDEIMVEIDGSSSTLTLAGNEGCICQPNFPASCPGLAYSCDFDCTQIIGTHILVRKADQNRVGDGICNYGLASSIAGLLAGCVYDHELLNIGVGIASDPLNPAYNRIYTVTVQSQAFNDCTGVGAPGNWGESFVRTIAKFTGSSDVPVEEWVDDIVLQRAEISPGAGYGCATSGMVAILRPA